MAKHRRTFTPEFKAEAVKLVTEQGRSVAAVARDLDLSERLLRSWKQALTVNGPRAFPGRGNSPALVPSRKPSDGARSARPCRFVPGSGARPRGLGSPSSVFGRRARAPGWAVNPRRGLAS